MERLGVTVGDGDCDGDCDAVGPWVGEVEVADGDVDGDATEITGDGDREGDGDGECTGLTATFEDAVGQAVGECVASGGSTAEGPVTPAFPDSPAAIVVVPELFTADTNWLGAGLGTAVGWHLVVPAAPGKAPVEPLAPPARVALPGRVPVPATEPPPLPPVPPGA